MTTSTQDMQGVTMPTITTYAKPTNDFVTIRIPAEYRSCSFQVMLLPMDGEDIEARKRASLPIWAGLCEGAITKNGEGPHDMDAIRESIKSADRISLP